MLMLAGNREGTACGGEASKPAIRQGKEGRAYSLFSVDFCEIDNAMIQRQLVYA
jgi:hypothetical protein